MDFSALGHLPHAIRFAIFQPGEQPFDSLCWWLATSPGKVCGQPTRSGDGGAYEDVGAEKKNTSGYFRSFVRQSSGVLYEQLLDLNWKDSERNSDQSPSPCFTGDMAAKDPKDDRRRCYSCLTVPWFSWATKGFFWLCRLDNLWLPCELVTEFMWICS